jgi:hypothetical protein
MWGGLRAAREQLSRVRVPFPRSQAYSATPVFGVDYKSDASARSYEASAITPS